VLVFSSCARFKPTVSRQIDQLRVPASGRRTELADAGSLKKLTPDENAIPSETVKPKAAVSQSVWKKLGGKEVDIAATEPVAATKDMGVVEEKLELPQSTFNTPAIKNVAFTAPLEDVPQLQQLPPAPVADGSQALPAAEIQPPISGDLTLAELEQLALGNNPTLVQAQAAITAAHGNWTQVGLYPNPQAGYQASEVGNDGKAGQQGAYVSQRFVTAGKLDLNRNTANYEITSANNDYETQQYRVLTSVRMGYYDVLIAQQRIELAKQLLTLSEKGVKVAEALVAAQQSAKVDLLQARVEANNSKVVLRQAVNDKKGALQRLESLIGSEQIQLSHLAGPWEPTPEKLTFSEVLANIQASSPELSAANANFYRAQAALQRARVQPTPDILTQLGAQYDYSSQYAIAGIQIGANLPLFNKNQGNIQIAQSELVAASRDIDRVQLDLKNRLADTMQAYNSSKYEMERYSKEIIPDAKLSLELVTSGYEKGEFGYNRLLTAQRTYFQTNIAYLEAVQAWWAAKLQIDGLLLSGGLNSQH